VLLELRGKACESPLYKRMDPEVNVANIGSLFYLIRVVFPSFSHHVAPY